MNTFPTPASSTAQPTIARATPPLSLLAPAGREDAGVGDREVILPDLHSTVRWFSHGYPTPLARWHHHPEIEFHLITDSHGHMMLGDQTLDFTPGQVSVIGPNLPHNWISHLSPGEVLPTRDILCQFLPERLGAASQFLPELIALDPLVDLSRRGLLLYGRSAKNAADLLIRMGQCSGLHRLELFLSLVEIVLNAPESEWDCVLSDGYIPSFDDDTATQINTVLTYIEDHLSAELSMTTAAKLLGMSPSSFSRFFHSTTGTTFSALVTRRRIARACHLLLTSDLSVARVAALSGYTNLANFNRRFREETGATPTSFRKNPRV